MSTCTAVLTDACPSTPRGTALGITSIAAEALPHGLLARPTRKDVAAPVAAAFGIRLPRGIYIHEATERAFAGPDREGRQELLFANLVPPSFPRGPRFDWPVADNVIRVHTARAAAPRALCCSQPLLAARSAPFTAQGGAVDEC